MNSVLLSIILPVYNVEAYLSACLDSILAQKADLSLVEVIAVNDGSTDTSGQILSDYQKAHPELFHIYTTENHGVSHARNYGVSKASGTYLWFVDSDDLLSSNAFEILFPLLTEGDRDLLLFGRYEESPQDHSRRLKLPECTLEKDSDFRTNPSQLAFVSPYPWDKVIRRAFFGETRFPEGIRFEDLPVAILTAARALRVLIVPEGLYVYRTSVGFLGTLHEGALDMVPALNTLTNFFRSYELMETYGEVLEFFAVKHCFLRFRQIIWNYDRDNRSLKTKIVTECFDYLDREFPSWQKNPLLDSCLADFLKRRMKLFSSRKRMLRMINLCTGRPAIFQKLYVKLFSEIL
ncbi:MAG: glycosyltransferase [Eubacteriales bacterium]|nr:glycosyltransferase [Eubacteriales bacterium]